MADHIEIPVFPMFIAILVAGVALMGMSYWHTQQMADKGFCRVTVVGSNVKEWTRCPEGVK